MGMRRRLLLGAAASAGVLMLGWGLLPSRQRLVPGSPLVRPEGEIALNGWLAIDRSGQVTVLVPKAEMGQGAHTAVAMMVADELDIDLQSVRGAHALSLIHLGACSTSYAYMFESGGAHAKTNYIYENGVR